MRKADYFKRATETHVSGCGQFTGEDVNEENRKREYQKIMRDGL